MSRYGNWHTKSHKKPIPIPVPKQEGNGMPTEWLLQAQSVHKEFGREGLLAFFRETERRDRAPNGSLDILLPMFGENE
jgi:hypothetical protein